MAFKDTTVHIDKYMKDFLSLHDSLLFLIQCKVWSIVIKWVRQTLTLGGQIFETK